MRGTNRTIARRLLSTLLLGTVLVAALAPAATAAPPQLKGAKTFVLPWHTTSYSVAVSPAGVPWFGTSVLGSLTLVSPTEAGGSGVVELDPEHELVKGNEYGSTGSLCFDGEGNLWFVRRDKDGQAVVRRAPDGTETAFEVPGEQPVGSLAIGPEGDVWMTRGARQAPAIGRLTPSGSFTSFPLEAGGAPGSIVAGPDGNLWFSEKTAGKIGRITPSGEVHQFALGAGIEPREIAAGPGDALWFTENGRKRRNGKTTDRIGHITTAGKVTQHWIPFGGGTERLVVDPRGIIWFSTEKGEISSLSKSGDIQPRARGCVGACASILSMAEAPDGTVWFSKAKTYKPCLECGGGTALLQQLEGAPFGKLPAGAVRHVPFPPAPRPTIEGAHSYAMPETTSGNSPAVAPDGTPWFGISAERGGPVLAHQESSPKLDLEKLMGQGSSGWTYGLQFDAAGNLWFVRKNSSGFAIVRRSPSGSLRTSRLPRGAVVNGLAPDPEGGVWFTRGHGEAAAIGRVSPVGKVSTTKLKRASLPWSIVIGPDGAAWFTERKADKIGRVTASGELQLFGLEPGTHPRQIVVGSDGALWFSERGRALPGKKLEDRIGRITTSGQVSQFPIPFGESTLSVAGGGSGSIWFSTETGELSSISTTGTVGAHGCYREYCASKIQSIALAPDGDIWFTASKEPVGGGGESTLMQENLGSPFGEVPAGALAPAE